MHWILCRTQRSAFSHDKVGFSVENEVPFPDHYLSLRCPILRILSPQKQGAEAEAGGGKTEGGPKEAERGKSRMKGKCGTLPNSGQSEARRRTTELLTVGGHQPTEDERKVRDYSYIRTVRHPPPPLLLQFRIEPTSFIKTHFEITNYELRNV